MATTDQRQQLTPTTLNGHGAADAPALPALRRNRTRVAFGALVIVLSVLGVTTLYSRASDRVDVLSVRRTVAAGQQITADDLGTVSISANTELRTMPASDLSRALGKIAVVALVPGSLLISSQLSDGPRVPPGMAIVGATLKPGQYPVGLRAGDDVTLVETPLPTATGAAATPIDRGTARVLETDQLKDAGSTLTVSLVVPAAGATPVASAGSAGRLTLVVIGAR